MEKELATEHTSPDSIAPAEAEAMKWFVMRDLKRANTLTPAYKTLPTMGFEVFTPMHQKVVVKGEKRLRVDAPVIADLLFVHSTKALLDPIVARIPTLQYRFMRGMPQFTAMTVPDNEMQRFIQACAPRSGTRFFSPDELTPDMLGKEVRVIGGPLDGIIARLLKLRGARNKRLVIELPGLLAVSVEVLPELLEPI